MKKILFALLMLCVSTPVWALNPTGTGWKTVCNDRVKNGKTVTTCKTKPDFNFVGLRLDAGAPDGFGASLVGRPLKFAQLELGGTTTVVGGGVRVGMSVFLPWYISPSAHVEYGHQWAGDVNKLIVMFGGSDPKVSLLNHVEYDYVNLHGGLGFGHPNWFMFRIQGGYSYVWGNTNGLQAYLQDKTNQSNLMISEANAKMWVPSGKLVFQFYF